VNEYDTTFKRLLRQSVQEAIRELTGSTVSSWYNVELPKTSSRTLDLLGESPAGELIHIELQSKNDPLMPLRMLEYYLRVRELFGRYPRQVLLYVGRERLRMESAIQTERLSYAYRVVDVRALDGDRLLGSSQIGDNIIAILTKRVDLRKTIRRVLEKIAALDAGGRRVALDELTTLAGLRKVAHIVGEETEAMTILDDIMDHDLYGPLIRKSEKRGERRGEVKGALKGKLDLIRSLLAKRFGPLPDWAETQLASLDLPALDALGASLLDAASLKELLPSEAAPRRGRRPSKS